MRERIGKQWNAPRYASRHKKDARLDPYLVEPSQMVAGWSIALHDVSIDYATI